MREVNKKDNNNHVNINWGNKTPRSDEQYGSEPNQGGHDSDSDSSDAADTDHDDSDDIWHSSESSEYSWDDNDLDNHRVARNDSDRVAKPMTIGNTVGSVSTVNESFHLRDNDVCGTTSNCEGKATNETISSENSKNFSKVTRNSSFRKRGGVNTGGVDGMDGTTTGRNVFRNESRPIQAENHANINVYKSKTSSIASKDNNNFGSITNNGGSLKHRKRKRTTKYINNMTSVSAMKRIVAPIYSILVTSTKISVSAGQQMLHFVASYARLYPSSVNKTHNTSYDGNKIYFSSTASDSSSKDSSHSLQTEVRGSHNMQGKRKVNVSYCTSSKSVCSIISTCLFFAAAIVWIITFLYKNIILENDIFSSKYGDLVLVSDPYTTVQQRTRARVNKIKKHYKEEPLSSNDFDNNDGFLARFWDYITFGSAGFSPNNEFKSNVKNSTERMVDKEALEPGCQSGATWQQDNHPYCNVFHETDMGDVLYRAAASRMTNDKMNKQTASTVRPLLLGYLDSGLWREVFAIDNPRAPKKDNEEIVNEGDINDNNKPYYPAVVLKMMKQEHDINSRNFDRHRRDAVAMEQLTASPYVVDLYGFCGNSVVTEFLPIPLGYATLSSSISTNIKKTKKHPIVRRGRRSNSTAVDEDDELPSINTNNAKKLPAPITRETEAGRFQLFYGVAKALHAIHTIQGGPIVHADLQSKQFLISVNNHNIRRNERIKKEAGSENLLHSPNSNSRIETNTGESVKQLPTIIIKMNDFNRCRFMATNVQTNKTCSFRIPTAPGKARSPEEYSYEELTEKLDLFATANIFYEIVTGKNPWQNYGSTETKRLIMKGVKPNFVPEKKILSSSVSSESQPTGSVDQELFQLTLRSYDRDPMKRISASELIEELEQIAKRYNIPILV